MAISNLVVGSFTLVLFLVLVAESSFWRCFLHFGANPRFGGGFCRFGGPLIGSRFPDPSRNDNGTRISIPSPLPHPGRIPTAPVPGKWVVSGNSGADAGFGKNSGCGSGKRTYLGVSGFEKVFQIPLPIPIYLEWMDR